MNDLREALLDPDLGAVPFTVERTSYRRDHGSLLPLSRSFPAVGCVHPAPAEALRLSPGEETREEMIRIYTTASLSAGENGPAAGSFLAADRIRVQGGTWRVVEVRPWSAFGLYRALAVRLDAEETEEAEAPEGAGG